LPTLVIWGAQDQLIGVEAARYYAGMFPDARFVAIEAAGHSPMEEKPEEFLKLVTDFLDEIDRRDEEPQNVLRLRGEPSFPEPRASTALSRGEQ
jgi:hypothetical protein